MRYERAALEPDRQRKDRTCGTAVWVARITDDDSPLAPIHLDIYGCNRDGIRLDMGSLGSFGAPAGETGFVSTGPP